MSKWTKIRRFRSSHRLWKNNENGQFYLADESGDGRSTAGTPDDTDDGPLRIDVTNPIRVSWENGMGSLVILPVVEEERGSCKGGRPSSTPATVGEMLYLSARFGWPIQSQEGFIHAVGMVEESEEEESGCC